VFSVRYELSLLINVRYGSLPRRIWFDPGLIVLPVSIIPAVLHTVHTNTVLIRRTSGRIFETEPLKVKGRFIGPSSALQPYRPIVPLAPMSSLIHVQRRHVPHRHERPQPAKEGTIQGILLAHS
jgi:hypothetical protein